MSSMPAPRARSLDTASREEQPLKVRKLSKRCVSLPKDVHRAKARSKHSDTVKPKDPNSLYMYGSTSDEVSTSADSDNDQEAHDMTSKTKVITTTTNHDSESEKKGSFQVSKTAENSQAQGTAHMYGMGEVGSHEIVTTTATAPPILKKKSALLDVRCEISDISNIHGDIPVQPAQKTSTVVEKPPESNPAPPTQSETPEMCCGRNCDCRINEAQVYAHINQFTHTYEQNTVDLRTSLKQVDKWIALSNIQLNKVEELTKTVSMELEKHRSQTVTQLMENMKRSDFRDSELCYKLDENTTKLDKLRISQSTTDTSVKDLQVLCDKSRRASDSATAEVGKIADRVHGLISKLDKLDELMDARVGHILATSEATVLSKCEKMLENRLAQQKNELEHTFHMQLEAQKTEFAHMTHDLQSQVENELKRVVQEGNNKLGSQVSSQIWGENSKLALKVSALEHKLSSNFVSEGVGQKFLQLDKQHLDMQNNIMSVKHDMGGINTLVQSCQAGCHTNASTLDSAIKLLEQNFLGQQQLTFTKLSNLEEKICESKSRGHTVGMEIAGAEGDKNNSNNARENIPADGTSETGGTGGQGQQPNQPGKENSQGEGNSGGGDPFYNEKGEYITLEKSGNTCGCLSKELSCVDAFNHVFHNINNIYQALENSDTGLLVWRDKITPLLTDCRFALVGSKNSPMDVRSEELNETFGNSAQPLSFGELDQHLPLEPQANKTNSRRLTIDPTTGKKSLLQGTPLAQQMYGTPLPTEWTDILKRAKIPDRNESHMRDPETFPKLTNADQLKQYFKEIIGYSGIRHWSKEHIFARMEQTLPKDSDDSRLVWHNIRSLQATSEEPTTMVQLLQVFYNSFHQSALKNHKFSKFLTFKKDANKKEHIATYAQRYKDAMYDAGNPYNYGNGDNEATLIHFKGSLPDKLKLAWNEAARRLQNPNGFTSLDEVVLALQEVEQDPGMLQLYTNLAEQTRALQQEQRNKRSNSQPPRVQQVTSTNNRQPPNLQDRGRSQTRGGYSNRNRSQSGGGYSGRSRSTSAGRCFNCNKEGHMAKDCWAPPGGYSVTSRGGRGNSGYQSRGRGYAPYNNTSYNNNAGNNNFDKNNNVSDNNRYDNNNQRGRGGRGGRGPNMNTGGRAGRGDRGGRYTPRGRGGGRGYHTNNVTTTYHQYSQPSSSTQPEDQVSNLPQQNYNQQQQQHPNTQQQNQQQQSSNHVGMVATSL